MITGEINIYEIVNDGPPEEIGDFLFWIDGGGFMLYSVTEEDIENFEDAFDGVAWNLQSELVIAYTNQEHLELGYL